MILPALADQKVLIVEIAQEPLLPPGRRRIKYWGVCYQEIERWNQRLKSFRYGDNME